jgi:hypothetical protein
MVNSNEIIKLLNNKLDNIKIKSSLSINDIQYINSNIEKLKNEIDNESNENINEKTKKTLRNVIRVILSTPTKNKKTYNIKKKFLSESPNIMFMDIGEIKSSYIKNYVKDNTNTNTFNFSDLF